MISYSKALRGLSVQSRVMGIFTHTSISPSPLLRQRPSRYAIRAGRNLPDKEFRYLRTVIVTVTRVLSFVLGFSPRPPASVCGTGTLTIVSAFSCQRGFTCFTTYFSLHIRPQALSMRTSLHTTLNPCTGSTINRLMLSFCVSASLIKVVLESPPVIHRLRLSSSA